MSRSIRRIVCALVVVVIAALAIVLQTGADDPRVVAVESGLGSATLHSHLSDKTIERMHRSRKKYAALNSRAAARAVARTLPRTVHGVNFPRPVLGKGKSVKKYTSPTTAIVDVPGTRTDALMDSTAMPVATAAKHGFEGVDTALEGKGDSYEPKNALITTELPAKSDGAIRAPSIPDEAQVAVTTTNKSVPALQIDSRKLFYANTDTDTDTVAETTPDGFELSWALRSVQSPESIALNFDSDNDVKLAAGDAGEIVVTAGDRPVGNYSARVRE